MTLRECWCFGKNELKEAGIAEYETDAWLLLEAAFSCSRNDLYLRGDNAVEETGRGVYLEYLDQRKKRVPVQYILGTQEFMGLEFAVTPAVLIPRQDTEVLVETAMKQLKAGDRILDMCTGSGCILISLLKRVKGTAGVGADLSAAALKIAEKNAEKHEADAQFVQSDLFENVEGSFEMIISNPPYIASGEIGTLQPEVRDMEPRMALDGRKDGLFFYRQMIPETKKYLKTGGWLMFEIGYDQGTAVSEMMEQSGYRQVSVIKDLAGLDRVVAGKLQEE
ncbi:MAG: peptide chain release factor N(5)-glutamine methyltransferase [Lachnospiraceae bacterium]